jgi:hypothetical protein
VEVERLPRVGVEERGIYSHSALAASGGFLSLAVHRAVDW